MSDILSFRSKLINSLLSTMGADLLRKADPNKVELTKEQVNAKIDSILDKYTEDISCQEPYSPIKFARWILKNANTYQDEDGFLSYKLLDGTEITSEALYNMYKDERDW